MTFYHLLIAVTLLALIPLLTSLFFFTLTRGALLLRFATGHRQDHGALVYPLYSRLRLIRLIDQQALISAILLFQYPRLVSLMVNDLRQRDLHGQDLLVSSCAFGNVIPRVAQAAQAAGVRQLLLLDLIDNELVHAKNKLQGLNTPVQCLLDDATASHVPDNTVSSNVIYFLLHELPHPQKQLALAEAMRVLVPGGKLYLAEFHRPDHWLMRSLSWLYFKVFEPWGLALWRQHDPLLQLQAMTGVSCEQHTLFFGNFQVIIATKGPATGH